MRLQTVGTLLLVATFSGGCGDEARTVRDARSYSADVESVMTDVSTSIKDLNPKKKRLRTKSAVQLQTRQLRRAIEGGFTRLEQLTPPAVMAASHGRLVAAFADWSSPIKQFERSLKKLDPVRIRKARLTFKRRNQQIELRVNSALNEINAKLKTLNDLRSHSRRGPDFSGRNLSK